MGAVLAALGFGGDEGGASPHGTGCKSIGDVESLLPENPANGAKEGASS